MQENIKILSLGCRLNIVESEKIRIMLADAGVRRGIIINTCAVTAESERQSRQMVRKYARENSGVQLFVTGCAATIAPTKIAEISGVSVVVANKDKMDISAYLPNYKGNVPVPQLSSFASLSKGFVQIQNGCNHSCAYCIVSKLRGKNVSFSYEKILADVRALVENGYSEIVLTGVDIAGYRYDSFFAISDLCRALLRDVPGMQRLRLSSLDPGIDLRPIIDLMRSDSRILPHMHLSMQSGSDEILSRMARRHNAQMVRELMEYANFPPPPRLHPPTASRLTPLCAPKKRGESLRTSKQQDWSESVMTPPLGGSRQASAAKQTGEPVGGQLSDSFPPTASNFASLVLCDSPSRGG